MKIKNESQRLRQHADHYFRKYSDLDEGLASCKLSEDTWSIKEIFGHLIDSAANNYQRFIRLQETENLSFPGYDYNWIKIVHYNSYPFSRILGLWEQLNYLICHIFNNMDETCLKNYWSSTGEKLTLEFLMTDYIDHMEIHFKQLADRYSEVSQKVSV